MGNTPSTSNIIPLKDNTRTTTLFQQEQAFKSKQVTYRIPALIYISENQTYLAFAEKRKTKDDKDAEVLVMRRGLWKDDKNEVKWVSGHQVLTSACLPNHRSMNPCPVYERDSKTLFLFFITVPVGVSENDQKKEKKNQARLCYITSKDTGKTWSGITDLKDVISEKEKNWATFAVGPGHGVQMKGGRLIIPACVYYFESKSDELISHAFAFYSDDKGSTWHVGKHIETKKESNECQMAEIIDDKGKSTLYCNARSTSKYRVEALSESNGEDFDKPFSDHKLPETGKGCQGSVLSFVIDESTWLLYSHPSDESKRKDLRIYVNKSPKDPMQWKPIQCINEGPSGYSDLAECKNRKYIACLIECGQKSEIEQIDFKLFDISDTVDCP